MKKLYETPEIKIILLDSEDILKKSDEDSEYDDEHMLPIVPLPKP